MTFGEFVQEMYAFLGNGVKVQDFILILIDNIVEDPSETNNPLHEYMEDSLKRIYTGARNLKPTNAAKILNHLDTLKFETYLEDKLTDSAKENIYNFLKKSKIQVENKHKCAEKCADILCGILKDLTKGKKSRRKDSMSTKKEYPADSRAAESKKERIIMPVPTALTGFTGRDKELEEIALKLKEDRVAFISGMGGIGKTSLIKEYINRHKHEYETVCFLTYNGSLVSTIADGLRIENYNADSNEKTEDTYRRKMEIISLYGSELLIVIDNFNLTKQEIGAEEHYVSAFYDEKLIEFTSWQYQVIFTSRTDCDGSIHIDHIQDYEKLMNLFLYHYKKEIRDLTPEDIQCVKDIIATVESHTLTIELIAKTLRESGVNPQNMLDKLQKNLQTDIDEVIAYGQKDRLMHEHIYTIFDLSTLKDTEKYVLMNMSLIPPDTGIEKSTFKEWIGVKNKNEINRLISLGWIKEDNKTDCISLHWVISDVVANKLEPDSIKCDVLIQNMTKADSSSNNDYLIAGIGKNLCKYIYEDENSIGIANLYIAIGNALYNTLQYKDALDLYIKAEEIFSSQNLYDKYIYDKIYSISVLYTSPTQSKKILEIQLREYEKLKTIIPPNPQRMIYVIPKLASYYDNKDNHMQAFLKLKEALDIAQESNIEKECNMAELYHKISVSYTHMHNYEMALEYAYKFLNVIKNYPLDEIELSKDDFFDLIGFIYSGLNMHESALNAKLTCLEIRESFFKDKTHPLIARICNRIGISYDDLGDFDNALNFKDRALKIRKYFAGKNLTIDVATSLNNIGVTYYKMGNFNKALEYFKQAYEIRIKIETTPISEKLSSYYNLGVILFRMGNLDEAWNYIKKALDSVKDNIYDNVTLRFPPVSNFHNQVIPSAQDITEWIVMKIAGAENK